MEYIKDFIVNNWQLISMILVIILQVVTLILKKFKVKINLPPNTYSKLIELIQCAEEIYGAGHGKEKKNYVLSRYIKDNDIKYFDAEVKWYISPIIESILSTPEAKYVQKGDKDGKKKDNA